MNASAEQLLFSGYCIGVVGILGNGLIGWELGRKGFHQFGLEGPRNKRVLLAVYCFFIMILWQSIRKLESPFSSWKYAWLPLWGIFIWVLSRQLVPRSVRLYTSAKFLHETTYTGNWQSSQPEVPIEDIRSNPRLQKAEKLYRQALKVQRSLSERAARDGERAQHTQNVVVTYCQLALLYLQRREFEEASKNAHEAVRLAEQLFANARGSDEISALFSNAIFQEAESDHALGRFDEARQKYERSLAMDRQSGDINSASVIERKLVELAANQRTRRT